MCSSVQEFNQSVVEMKPQVSAVQTQGKQLKESCSSQVWREGGREDEGDRQAGELAIKQAPN